MCITLRIDFRISCIVRALYNVPFTHRAFFFLHTPHPTHLTAYITYRRDGLMGTHL